MCIRSNVVFFIKKGILCVSLNLNIKILSSCLALESIGVLFLSNYLRAFGLCCKYSRYLSVLYSRKESIKSS